MWGWLMGLFASRYQPLERPAPLSGHCGMSLNNPDLREVRAIQHDADNVITHVRGRRDFARRYGRPDPFTEGLHDAWRGPEQAQS
jgi:hypothetical protein